MKRTRGRHGGDNREHQSSQRIRVLCSEGRHRLGTLHANVGDLLMFELGHGEGGRPGSPSSRARRRNPSVWIEPEEPLLRREGRQLVATCPACYRAGLIAAERPTKLSMRRFHALFAAQRCYGPASVTVSFNTRSLKRKLEEVIPEGDRLSKERRELFKLLEQPLQPGPKAQPLRPGELSSLVSSEPALRDPYAR